MEGEFDSTPVGRHGVHTFREQKPRNVGWRAHTLERGRGLSNCLVDLPQPVANR